MEIHKYISTEKYKVDEQVMIYKLQIRGTDPALWIQIPLHLFVNNIESVLAPYKREICFYFSGLHFGQLAVSTQYLKVCICTFPLRL